MFVARSILTAILLTCMGGLLLMDHYCHVDVGFNIIVFLAVILSVQEFYDLSRLRGYTPYASWGTLCAGLMVLADWLGFSKFHPDFHWMGIVAFVFLAGLFILQGWLRPRKEGLVSMAITTMAIVYVWGLIHFIVRIYYFRPDTVGICGVLLTVAVVKAGDIAAYLAGSRFGKHRPFPHISPKKSWEGYAGGLIASVLVALLLAPVLFDKMNWLLAVVFAVPVGLFGHLGDLAESVIKRDLNAKDSAVRLPGLGGVLDVLDSLLLAGPVAFYLLEQMVQWGCI